jgi:hypothetical protein
MADPGRNAFLLFTPSSKQELISQFDTHPTVRDKYLRHFAMTAPELRAYFQTLKLKPLTYTGTYTVYSVPNTGEVAMHLETLNAGERVFVDPAGTPILRARCGNPLARGPVNPTSPNSLQASVMGTPVDIQSPMDVPTVAQNEVALSQPGIPTLPELPPAVTTPPTTTPTVTTPPPTTGHSNEFFALPVLMGGGALFGGHGSGSGGRAPVPEPATMLALTIGAAGILKARKRQ